MYNPPPGYQGSYQPSYGRDDDKLGAKALLLLWFVVEDHDTLFILSESVHFLGIGVLAYKLLTKKNCSGLSLRTQELTAVFLLVRLFCSFMMEYDIHTLLDFVTLAATGFVIYCLRGPLKESYQAELDSLNPLVVAVPCLLMAFIAKPTTRHMFIFRVMWAFCVYLEAVSVLPQLRMMQKAKVVEKFTAHYVFALGLSRFISCAHWILQILDGDKYLWQALGSGLWPVMVLVSEIVQTFILADFCYYYVKSYAEGTGVIHLPAVRVYDAAANTLQGTFVHGAPVLDAVFENDGVIYTGGLDNAVKRYDFFAGQEAIVGFHTAPVRCTEWLPGRGLLVTGSWDGTLRLWDPRQPGGQGLLAKIQLQGKVYTMSASDSRLVVGSSGRHVDIFDIRRLESGQAEQRRESSLKYQTRCIRCFTDGQGYALSSVEGRVAMEWFDLGDEAQAKKYAFKCHRKNEGGKDVVYPVNAIAFNQAYGTFATGGADGVVNLWDGANKKRLHQISGYPTSVAAIAFNSSATLMAVAASYTYEQGEKEQPRDAIFVRDMLPAEVAPKARRQD
ncbi:hypothetical protein N2152v2_009780 [Parachlorella kessleri]